MNGAGGEPGAERTDLRPDHAFVVQFAADVDLDRSAARGRVEHVLSGRATHFRSLPELVRFCTEVLRSLPRAEEA